MNQQHATIIAALLTGLVGPTLLWWMNRRASIAPLAPLKGELAAIVGVWRGEIYNDHPLALTPTSPLRMEFSGKRTVEGKGEIVAPNEEILRLKFIGGVRHGRYLMLDYSGEDPSMKQFGAAVLELDSRGKEFRGRFLGYGAIHDSMVYGRVILRRST